LKKKLDKLCPSFKKPCLKKKCVAHTMIVPYAAFSKWYWDKQFPYCKKYEIFLDEEEVDRHKKLDEG